MAMRTTDEGILLHRINYSDSSLILTFFTNKHGLQKFIYKGGKKRAHNLFPLSICELTYYHKPERDLQNLTAAESNFNTTFQFNPIRSSIAFFVAEIIRKCSAPMQEDGQLYNFLKRNIASLNETDKVQLFPILFCLELSAHLGFQPQCNQSDASLFNLESGTFQVMDDPHSKIRKGEGAELIKALLLSDNPAAISIHDGRKEALEILLEYFSIHVPNFETVESYDIVRAVLND